MKDFKTKALQVLEQEKKNIVRYINNLKGDWLDWSNFRYLNIEKLKLNVWLTEGITYSLENIDEPDEIVFSTIINCIEQPGIKPFNPEELMELREYCYSQINEKL